MKTKPNSGYRGLLKTCQNARIFFRCAALKNLEIHEIFLQMFALPGKKTSRLWTSSHFSNKP